jgi:hypothetical protein
MRYYTCDYVQTTFRADPETLRKLDEESARLRLSFNSTILKIVDEYFAGPDGDVPERKGAYRTPREWASSARRRVVGRRT